jgi:protein-S-isoprenylcysteine O-methyltransferase Ste14
MKASWFEFRFRMVLIVVAIALGFWAPWIEWLHLGLRTTTWLWLGFELGELGISSTRGIVLVTALAIATAALAAALRIWGTAYLGAQTVYNPEMKARQVMADGPYRYIRNPLYLGSWLMIATISVLMPPTGAAVTMVLLTILLFRLILAEERFLAGRLGESYLAYRAAVPRLVPALRPRVPAGGSKPHWRRALLGELTPLGVLASFSALSWQYNASLLIRAVLVCFGISLVVRALLPPSPSAAGAA